MTNEERAVELVKKIERLIFKDYCNQDGVKLILTHDDEIRRECADRAVAWQVKLCADDDWTCERCTECNQLRYAIMGKEATK